MKILVDMNLSPEWVSVFTDHAIEARHWSSIGSFDAPDKVIMKWVRENNHVVFTHDLDFGTALALSNAEKPSVVQVRTQNVAVSHLKDIVINTLSEHAVLLEKGALLVLDEHKMRVRILPL